MDRPLWAPTEVDITRPSVARVYDYYLGGSHNFESDRDFAQPGRRRLPRAAHRRCARTAPSCGAWCATCAPRASTSSSTSARASRRRATCTRSPQAANPAGPGRVRRPRPRRRHPQPSSCWPATTAHAWSPPTSASPEHVLAQAAVDVGGLDLDRPVAVLAVAVLHFVPDERTAGRAHGATTCARSSPGSHLAISHARSDGVPEAVAGAAALRPRTAPWNRCTRARAAEIDGAVRRPDPARARPRRRPPRGGRTRPDDDPDVPATTTRCSPAWRGGTERAMAEAAGRGGRPPPIRPPRPRPTTADRLARAWARAVADTSFVPMDRRGAAWPSSASLAADLLAALRPPRPSTAGCPCGSAPRSSTPTSPRPARSSAPWPCSVRELAPAAAGPPSGRLAALQGARRRRLRPAPCRNAPAREQERISASAFAARAAPSRRGGTARPASGRSSPRR